MSDMTKGAERVPAQSEDEFLALVYEQRGYRAAVMAVQCAVQQILDGLPKPQYVAPKRAICGMVAPNATPGGNPVACAWQPGHLADRPHSWADLPTVAP